MIGALSFKSWTYSRIAQHVLFWLVIFFSFTLIYAVKSSFWISFRNNLFYIPLHMLYYYILAYWMLPRYLFTGKYFKFSLLMLALIFGITVLSRLVDILIAIPYLVAHSRNVDWDMVDTVKNRSFWSKLTDLLFFVNAFKMMHFVIWFALGIKLFKLFYERKQAALQAELNALKGQIHPHFLFNTLNNLYALTLANSSKSSQVVLGLSELLRYMLYECNTEQVSLHKEVTMLQQYISLEKLRYEDRIDINFTVDGDLQNKLIAPLIMLTFVENAFKHGTSDILGEVWVNIDLHVDGDRLKFKVSNCKAEIKQADADKHYGHIGLLNVQKRLDLLYPSAYQLKIFDDGDTFLIVLELTLKSQAQPLPQLTIA